MSCVVCMSAFDAAVDDDDLLLLVVLSFMILIVSCSSSRCIVQCSSFTLRFRDDTSAVSSA